MKIKSDKEKKKFNLKKIKFLNFQKKLQSFNWIFFFGGQKYSTCSKTRVVSICSKILLSWKYDVLLHYMHHWFSFSSPSSQTNKAFVAIHILIMKMQHLPVHPDSSPKIINSTSVFLNDRTRESLPRSKQYNALQCEVKVQNSTIDRFKWEFQQKTFNINTNYPQNPKYNLRKL